MIIITIFDLSFRQVADNLILTTKMELQTKDATTNLSTHKHMHQLNDRLQDDINSLKALSQTLK
jgi:hypothetical protein